MRPMTLALLLAVGVSPALAQTPPEGAPTPPSGGLRSGGLMMRADADGDGVLTRAEAIAEAGARFDRLDANHDGRLTRDEMCASWDRGRGDRPPPPPER